MSNYETIIGLELHAQLSTNTKMFCRCPSRFETNPNLNICPVCSGQAGALPVLNSKAVEYAVKTAMALNCEINKKSVFSRKSYFYPDLPKGYQISQYDEPLAEAGYVELTIKDAEYKRIGITRVHMEEDAGKNTHNDEASYVDLNRAGVPLIEIVSEPDIRTAQEAVLYFKKIKTILEYLGTCDCNMELGNLRCDANISVRPIGQKKFGTKVEIKNLNSFRFLEKALVYEQERQIDALKAGLLISQETRLFDSINGVTRSMRKKEEANDYRYFPEPDLRPLVLNDELLDRISGTLPELPDAKIKRFITQYKLSTYDSAVLCSEQAIANYYERLISYCSEPKLCSNWMQTVILKVLNDQKKNISQLGITEEAVAELLNLIKDGTININTGKTVFDIMLNTKRPAIEIVKTSGLEQIKDDGLIEEIVDAVIKDSNTQVEQYKNGKTAVLGFLVGQVMKKSGGKAQPEKVNELLKKKLG